MRCVALIGDLIAHARQQLERPSITQFGIEFTFEHLEDVPQIAPVIRQIAWGVFHLPHPQVADGERPPDGFSRFAGMHRRRNGGPICDGERQRRNIHFRRPWDWDGGMGTATPAPRGRHSESLVMKIVRVAAAPDGGSQFVEIRGRSGRRPRRPAAYMNAGGAAALSSLMNAHPARTVKSIGPHPGSQLGRLCP